jgi:hypothetical protein
MWTFLTETEPLSRINGKSKIQIETCNENGENSLNFIRKSENKTKRKKYRCI